MADLPKAIFRCANCGFSYEWFEDTIPVKTCNCPAGTKPEWVDYRQAEPMLQQLALWMPERGHLREQMWWFLRRATGSDDDVRALIERARDTVKREAAERFDKLLGV